jgi:DNA-binding IclR family transcriptional regulator
MNDRPVRPANGHRPDDLVRSVSRALRVLEVISSSPGLPVKAIARRAELNISTTYHLVRTLAYEGYVLRLPDGCYEIGPEVPRRFHDLVDSFGRPPGAPQVLRRLSEATGLTAYLGLIRNGRVIVADVTEGPGSPYLEDLEVGLDVAAHATALGKALLASMPRGQRRQYLADQGLRPFTRNTRTDLAAIEADLRQVDLNHPVIEHGEFRDGVSCAAGLVPRSEPGDPFWTVGVSVRGDDLSARVNAEVMRAAHDLATA